ncbi:MAG: hypothetical protein HRU19_28035 [Pseudobacteriovorax sp.]|nr:hypothetical protein [Pseudobacteriovorax sp.]
MDFENQIYLTDQPRISIFPRYSTFEDLDIQVRGDILPTAKTFTTIPFEESIEVILNPSQGTRRVIVDFFIEDELVATASNQIYLRPIPSIRGTFPNFTIVLNNIIELESVTIQGCSTEMNRIPFQEIVNCTQIGASIDITYHFIDGTDLSF